MYLERLDADELRGYCRPVLFQLGQNLVIAKGLESRAAIYANSTFRFYNCVGK